MLVGLVLSAAALSGAGQDASFRASVEVVELDVAVTRDGKPVRGLTARDFAVTDNGAEQTVANVTFEQAPLGVVLALDVSRSVSGIRLAQLIEAGRTLNDALRPADEAAIVTFSHQVQLLVPPTTDRRAILAGLEQLNGLGSTSLRDAVYLALQLRPSDRGRRPVVLLFSDGEDNGSWLSEADVVESARRASTVLHVIGFGRQPFLERIASATGGRVWRAESDAQLKVLFSQALEDMRGRYVLTYSPAGGSRPGWHAISVRVPAQRASITARPGYFVP